MHAKGFLLFWKMFKVIEFCAFSGILRIKCLVLPQFIEIINICILPVELQIFAISESSVLQLNQFKCEL